MKVKEFSFISTQEFNKIDRERSAALVSVEALTAEKLELQGKL